MSGDGKSLARRLAELKLAPGWSKRIVRRSRLKFPRYIEAWRDVRASLHLTKGAERRWMLIHATGHTRSQWRWLLVLPPGCA